MEAVGGTHLPMATQASGATCVPVSHGVVFGAAACVASLADVPLHRSAPNKKPASASFLAGFLHLHRIASTQSMVPGTGLEPASQLRRRIFVTLLLSKPASRARTVRALDYAFTVACGRDRCPCALGAPRLVSTPSSRMPRGLARRCLDARIRGFAEFEGFCTDRFRPGTQSFKSAMFTNFITPARGRTRFYHCWRMRSLIPRAPYRAPAIVAPLRPAHSAPIRHRCHTADDFVPRRTLPRYNRPRVVRRPQPSDVCVVLFTKQASRASSRSHKRFR